jgi:hypothetical protein
MPSTNEYLLLLTACIDPSTGPAKIARADPLLRLRDYQNALRFWLAYPDSRIKKILFVENSNYSLDSLKTIASQQNSRGIEIEFLSLETTGYPEGFHYGYAECQMIDVALERSRLAASATHFIKVTGRLTFPGLTRLLDRLPNGFKVAVDARNNTWFVRSPQRFITTQLMLFEKSFFAERLQKLYHELKPIEEGVYLVENLYYHALMPLRDSPGVILRFPCNVDPHGFAAHWTKNYTAPKQRAISLARVITRRLLPNWWV